MPVYKAAEKTKDGRQWYFVVCSTINGAHKNYKSKKYITKKEAEAEEAKYLFTIGKITDVNLLTFGQIIEEYRAEKTQSIKPQSWLRSKVLCDYVNDQLGNVPIVKLTAKQYEDFRVWINAHNWSVCYKNKCNKMLKALINYAFKRHGIDNRIPYRYDAFKDVLAPVKAMEFYTFEEFSRFISVIPYEEFRYKALFLVLFYCGLRIGEANCLTWNDVDLEKGTLSINKTVSTKVKGKGTKYLITSPKTASSIRTIPIQKKALEALRKLKGQWERYEGFTAEWYVFGGVNPIPETTLTKQKIKYANAAEVKVIRIHDFRHSCASYYIHLGATASVLAKLLGHSSTKMTLDTYSHFYLTDLNALIELANN